jgi:hypothetical protein
MKIEVGKYYRVKHHDISESAKCMLYITNTTEAFNQSCYEGIAFYLADGVKRFTIMYAEWAKENLVPWDNPPIDAEDHPGEIWNPISQQWVWI